MMTIFNTTFFFAETIAEKLCAELRTHWLKASTALGVLPPLVLKMDSEEGVCRLAIQTYLQSRAEAARFEEEIASVLIAYLSSMFGPEKFTAFSTIMEETEL
ncbi:MAG: DUF4286 family protein [Muribaculaceae bacterium]|nr:DUF4286 family protein [Muribaculaceae bacterium]